MSFPRHLSQELAKQGRWAAKSSLHGSCLVAAPRRIIFHRLPQRRQEAERKTSRGAPPRRAALDNARLGALPPHQAVYVCKKHIYTQPDICIHRRRLSQTTSDGQSIFNKFCTHPLSLWLCRTCGQSLLLSPLSAREQCQMLEQSPLPTIGCDTGQPEHPTGYQESCGRVVPVLQQ